MVSAPHVAREAAKTVMSGPASGVMAAVYTARRAGIADLITYDMGGTSTDVALIRDGAPAISNEIELEYAMPIHVPMVDVRTVGAGGGSIARVNAAGLLEVGPESAGADPGPIASGRGGTRPTITDANLLLGRLDPARFPGAAAVRAAFAETLGRPARPRPPRPPPPPSSASPTPGWPTPSAWSRSRSAPTPATSPSSPSAAPARCTPPRSPASSASPASSSPPAPASPTRSAASSPTSATTSSAP